MKQYKPYERKNWTLCKKCNRRTEAICGVFDSICKKCLKEKEEINRHNYSSLYGRNKRQ